MSRKRWLPAGLLLLLSVSLTLSPVAKEVPRGEAQDTSKKFSMPSAFPLYSAPPVHYRGNRMFVVTATTTSEVLRRLVPEPLAPNPGNLIVVFIASLNIEKPDASRFNYLEVGIVVPVVFSETNAPGNFVLCLYLNQTLPIAGGREIWGYPKKDAEITFVEKDGELTGRMERFGTVLLNVRGRLEKRIEPDPRERRTPYFVEKIIPSARKNAPPDVWQLVSSPVVDATTHELWSGTAELELKSGPDDPLASIGPVRVESAQFSVSDFTLDYGEVLHNYLTETKSNTSATNVAGKAPNRN